MFLHRRLLQDPAEVLRSLAGVGAVAHLQLRLQVHGAEEGRVHLRHLRNTGAGNGLVS